MRKLALALAAVAALGFAAPSLVSDASAAQGQKIAQADVKVKVGGGERRHVKKLVVKRDRGIHRGWAHSRHYGASKKVIIKRGHGRTVKKVIKHG